MKEGIGTYISATLQSPMGVYRQLYMSRGSICIMLRILCLDACCVIGQQTDAKFISRYCFCTFWVRNDPWDTTIIQITTRTSHSK